MSNSELISIKGNYKKILMEKLKVAYESLGAQVLGADKVSINENIKSLEKEIQEIGRQIEELKAQGSNTDINFLFKDIKRNWKEKLHEYR